MRNLYLDKKAWGWLLKAARSQPSIVSVCLKQALSSRIFPEKGERDQLVFCAYHKVLSTYLSRICHGYAFCTNRSISNRVPGHGDYSADILFDDHSHLDIDRLKSNIHGLRVTRDPRDIVVSSTFYHQKSDEQWLHEPRSDFAGECYQEKLKAQGDFSRKMMFEIDHASGDTIRDMELWRGHPNIVDIDYSELLGDSGKTRLLAFFSEIGTPDIELKLIASLIDFFGIDGGAQKFSAHVRNPSPSQWAEYFDDGVTDYFKEKFPKISKTLEW